MYCNNNPIMYEDSTGRLPSLLNKLVKAIRKTLSYVPDGATFTNIPIKRTGDRRENLTLTRVTYYSPEQVKKKRDNLQEEYNGLSDDNSLQQYTSVSGEILVFAVETGLAKSPIAKFFPYVNAAILFYDVIKVAEQINARSKYNMYTRCMETGMVEIEYSAYGTRGTALFAWDGGSAFGIEIGTYPYVGMFQ